MPGWIGHNININVKNGIKANISLPHPCDSLAAEINSDLNNISNRVEGGIGSLTSELASESQSLQISTLSSFGSNKSGRLAGSIISAAGGNTAKIGTNLYYASYVNEGRGSVTAVGKALHFHVGGTEIFVKSVGPATPRPYVDVSGELLESRMTSIVERYMGAIL